MIKMNIKVDFDPNKVSAKLQKALDQAQMALDQQVLKDSNYYIPKDTTNLEQSSIRTSHIGEGLLIWDTPYARRLYHHPEYDFSQDKNPNASGLWFEYAKAAKGDHWVRLAQQTFNQNYQ
ncbi:minor capsid protein [Bacillus sp. OTU530]|uniref:minor capsid protein n=1 Tax=Bacillus sp. OTU530 TaxID=3043862 RepID=UPI00313E4135